MTAPFDDRGENFLSRWSRRKRSEPERRDAEDRRVSEEMAVERGLPPAPAEPPPLKAPADLPAIESLTPESDFSRFMRPDVPVASRSAAMKKLFADPHFNVMDGLDTYIEDYTRPDPIPVAMLRDLAQSRMLKLFDDVEEEGKTADAPATGTAAEAQGAALDPPTGARTPLQGELAPPGVEVEAPASIDPAAVATPAIRHPSTSGS